MFAVLHRNGNKFCRVVSWHAFAKCINYREIIAIYCCRKYKSIKPDIMNNLTILEEADQALHQSPFHSQKSSTVMIEVQNMPTFQLIRNVSFDRLDFVVSIGGIIGLFFGASIIGLAEIIYIWILRKCWTACLFHTIFFLVWHIRFENKEKMFLQLYFSICIYFLWQYCCNEQTALILCADKQIMDALTNFSSLTVPIISF